MKIAAHGTTLVVTKIERGRVSYVIIDSAGKTMREGVQKMAGKKRKEAKSWHKSTC